MNVEVIMLPVGTGNGTDTVGEPQKTIALSCR